MKNQMMSLVSVREREIVNFKSLKNMKLILLTSFMVVVNCLPQISNPRWQHHLQSENSEEGTKTVHGRSDGISTLKKPTELELQQNKNAHYSFNTNIDDKINDQTQQRSEVRDGLKVEGSYSYSDGFFRRVIHYIADDKGYRIVKSEVIPLEGPKINLEGTASVDTEAHGSRLSYKVKSISAVGPKVVEKLE